jgi:hypothetical protein
VCRLEDLSDTPLFDRRTAGWKALESALGQSMDRDGYEIIVVHGRPEGDEATGDAHAQSLLQRCDAVVQFAVDANQQQAR